MKTTALLLGALAMACVSTAAHGQSYVPDLTFGTAGRALITFPTASTADDFTTLAQQPNGSIILAGRNNTGFGIARITPDGQPDPTFGTGGLVTTPITINYTGITTRSASPSAALVQADGKIFVAGLVTTATINWRMYMRYLANGSVDASFGVAGPSQGNYSGTVGAFIPNQGSGGLSSVISGVQQQADGKLLSVGYRLWLSGSLVPETARITDAGDFDAAYLSVYPTGVAYGSITTTAPSYASAIDSNDRLLTAGSYDVTNSSYTGPLGASIVRYLSTGSFDPSFGTNGIAILPPAVANASVTAWTKLVLQPDGKIVVAGVRAYTSSTVQSDTLVLARYTANGALDTSFGKNGVLKIGPGTQAYAASTASVFGLKLLSTGDIVAGIRSNEANGTASFAILRLSATGALVSTLPALMTIAGLRPVDMAVQANNKIIVAGTQTGSSGSKNYVAMRFDYSAALSSRPLSADNTIQVFPNPATHDVTVRLADATSTAPVTIRFLNALGQAVATYPAVRPTSGELRLAMPAIAAGSYTLLVQGADFVATRRLAKVD